MATKTPPKATPFTINLGVLTIVFPHTYVPDARRDTFTDNDYATLTKGRDSARTSAALRQLADACEAEPGIIPLPADLQPARLRELADKLDANTAAKNALDSAAVILSRLNQLDRDSAADACNEILDLVKAGSRRSPELKTRFDLLVNLNKKV